MFTWLAASSIQLQTSSVDHPLALGLREGVAKSAMLLCFDLQVNTAMLLR
jgi:hypothetical protein